jgi:hypothetical protein
MLWVETGTDKEAQALRASIWDPVTSTQTDGSIVARSPGPVEAGGEFWYETLQREKGDPARRYEIARRHLPLPAAWREMAIALRAMIKQARKEGGDFEPQLRELYQLAAIWSFSAPAPSGRAGPGYGVIEMTPYGKLAALDLAWSKIGCDELSLLNASDRKLMRQLWGEPDQHTTAQDLYREFFDQQARKVAAAHQRSQRERHARFMGELDAIGAGETAKSPPAPRTKEQPPQRPGFLARLLGKR